MQSPGKIGTRKTGVLLALLVLVLCACATGPAGGPDSGEQAITIHVDNMTSRVVTVEHIVAAIGVRGSTSFGNVQRRSERPVTRRVGVVNGKSRRTLTVPWYPARLAHEILWLEGVERVASGTETLGPGQRGLGYVVEECRGEGLRACVETFALHLPPGSEVSLVIDRRHEARMYYQLPRSVP